MMRSLYSGVSGLRNHQTRMDVIGNNIANVNTVGYKTARVMFQDIFSQNVAAGSAADPGAGRGGTNPMQIGLGIRMSTVDVIHTASAFARTDRPTDMMINGDGFFRLENPEDPDLAASLFTRAGNFDIDSEGFLVSSHGFFVRGWEVDPVTGDPADPPVSIRIRLLDDDTNFMVAQNGDVSVLRGGARTVIARLDVTLFRNPAGLEKAGNSLFRASASSGPALPGFPGEDGRGVIDAGGLEMSNVDLADQFTDMIVTQRGFQANSRIITVSDTMLEELVNLKR